MKKGLLRKNASHRIGKRRAADILLTFLILAMLGTFIVLGWQKCSTPSRTEEFEGAIVDRWADYAETDQGSRPRFHLLIEGQDGKRFGVVVGPDVYESAKVGMRIKSRSGQVVLIDSEKGTTFSR